VRVIICKLSIDKLNVLKEQRFSGITRGLSGVVLGPKMADPRTIGPWVGLYCPVAFPATAPKMTK